jgi:hypothetical protein
MQLSVLLLIIECVEHWHELMMRDIDLLIESHITWSIHMSVKVD